MEKLHSGNSELANLDFRQNSLLVHLFNGTFSVLLEEAASFQTKNGGRNCKNGTRSALDSDKLGLQMCKAHKGTTCTRCTAAVNQKHLRVVGEIEVRN